MSSFIEGFFLQASLILALGAQNLFVLESGLKKQRHLWVAAICSVCDAVLILIGVAGAASVFVQVPALKILFGFLGVIFLFYYGVRKLIEVIWPVPVSLRSNEASNNLRKIIWLTLAFSLLNPHVYLDTVVLVGGYSSQYLGITERLIFGAGAAAFSTLWFFGLATAASFSSRLLGSREAMRVVALVSGVILIWLSFKLGADVWQWAHTSILF